MALPAGGRGRSQPRSSQDFTDRETHVAALRRLLDLPEGTALPVLAFHGVGGRGKTKLLDKLADILDAFQPPIPHARFDVENLKSPVTATRDVLLRLRVDLEADFGLKFPRFDLVLAVLLATEGGAPPALVTLNPTLKDTFEFTMSFLPVPVDKIGKFLEKQARKWPAAERLLARAGGREEILKLRDQARRDPAILADALIGRFADDLAAGLLSRPGLACRGVLFFDTFEALWRGLDQGRSVQARRLEVWLRDLARAARQRGVLVVVAGRDGLLWAEDDFFWKDAIEIQ